MVKVLFWVEYPHNTLPSVSTGMSPFHCIYGYQPLFPSLEQETQMPAASTMVHHCRRYRAKARQTLPWTSEKTCYPVFPGPEGVAVDTGPASSCRVAQVNSKICVKSYQFCIFEDRSLGPITLLTQTFTCRDFHLQHSHDHDHGPAGVGHGRAGNVSIP